MSSAIVIGTEIKPAVDWADPGFTVVEVSQTPWEQTAFPASLRLEVTHFESKPQLVGKSLSFTAREDTDASQVRYSDPMGLFTVVPEGKEWKCYSE